MSVHCFYALGRAVAQRAGRCSSTAEAVVRSQASHFVICGGQSDR